MKMARFCIALFACFIAFALAAPADNTSSTTEEIATAQTRGRFGDFFTGVANNMATVGNNIGNIGNNVIKFPFRVSHAALNFSEHIVDMSLSPIKRLGGKKPVQISNDWEDLKMQGTPANIADYPFIVGVESDLTPICGGVLVDNLHVITSAHCFDKIDTRFSKLTIMYQSDKSTALLKNVKRVSIAKINLHPCYDKTSPELYNDIAVLTLGEEVVFNKYVTSIELPLSTFSAEKSGNGITLGYYKGFVQAEVQIVDLEECSKYHDVSTHQICVTKGRENCLGYAAGMPLLQTDSAGYGVLSGIGSYSAQDCNKVPTVYTRVSKYVGWIRKIVRGVQPSVVC